MTAAGSGHRLGLPPDHPAVADLLLAAELFLRGQRSSGNDGRDGVRIGREAIERVAQTLAARDPSAVTSIRAAVCRFRQDASWDAHQEVVTAVTAAAAVH